MKRVLLGAALAALTGVANAQAQAYPSKPITIVIPLAAGGAVDRMVRSVIEPMKASLGQPILVETMGGAGGTLGVARVARAAPDGYTISVGTWGTHVLNAFVYTAVRPPEGFRAGGAAAERAAMVHRTKRLPGGQSPGTDRLAEGQSRQGHLRVGRHRRQLDGLHLLFPENHRHHLSDGALSRRRSGLAGHRRRQHRHDVRSRGELAAAGARRQRQGLRGDVEEALVCRPRCADR